MDEFVCAVLLQVPEQEIHVEDIDAHGRQGAVRFLRFSVNLTIRWSPSVVIMPSGRSPVAHPSRRPSDRPSFLVEAQQIAIVLLVDMTPDRSAPSQPLSTMKLRSRTRRSAVPAVSAAATGLPRMPFGQRRLIPWLADADVPYQRVRPVLSQHRTLVRPELIMLDSGSR